MLRRLRGAPLVALLVASVAQGAPIGTLKQFKVPSASSDPKSITQGSDGNFWFTESHVRSQTPDHNVGQITPAGVITEFLVCDFCFPNDIVQGPDGILYFTKSAAALGRITTAGQVLSDVNLPFPNGNGLAAHGDDIWITDFNQNLVWRYNVISGAFTSFVPPTPASDPYDVAVDANGIVWFTEFQANRIGRIDPNNPAVTEIVTPGNPRELAVATDGSVWFTERFDNAVGRFDPSTSALTMFPLTGGGPEGIAASPDGSVWFAQSVAGNIARITAAGGITEVKPVKGSEPFGVTVAPDGNPWYAELSANKIAVFVLR
jgi:virginiamycin B lyase